MKHNEVGKMFPYRSSVSKTKTNKETNSNNNKKKKQNKKPKVLLGMVRVSNPELWMLRWKNLDYNRDWNTLKDFASTNKLLNTVYSLVLFIYKNVSIGAYDI